MVLNETKFHYFLDLDYVYFPNLDRIDGYGLSSYSNCLQLQRILNRLELVKTGVRLSDEEVDKIMAFIKANKEDIKEELKM